MSTKTKWCVLVFCVTIVTGGLIPIDLEKDINIGDVQRSQEFVECNGHGLQPSNESCSTFYHCVDLSDVNLRWLAFRFNCPDGMVFDKVERECSASSHRVNQIECKLMDKPMERSRPTKDSGNALVVTTDPKTNKCTDMKSLNMKTVETRIDTCKRDMEIMLELLPTVRSSIANTSKLVNQIQSKHSVPSASIPNTRYYEDASIVYKKILNEFQNVSLEWIRDGGVLTTLDEIFTSVGNLESLFLEGISKTEERIKTISSEKTLLRSVEAEKMQLKVLTEQIQTCLNFSEYGYAAHAMMAFLVDDLNENQLLDSQVMTTDVEGHNLVLHELQAFMKYVNKTAGEVLGEIQTKREVFSNQLYALERVRSYVRESSVNVAEFIQTLEQERDNNQKKRIELLSNKRKMVETLGNKHKRLTEDKDKQNQLTSWFSVLSGVYKRILVSDTQIKNIKKDLSFENRIKKRKHQISSIHLKLISVDHAILKLDNDTGRLTEELSLLQNLDEETKDLLLNTDAFLSEIVRLLAFLTDIVKLIGAVHNQSQSDENRSRLISVGHVTLAKLHLYMAIEDLKWHWIGVGSKFLILSNCRSLKK